MQSSVDTIYEKPERRTCCMKCKFFDSRNFFCRFNPPRIMLDNNGYYITCWPKITCPMLDWCSHFESINTSSKEVEH